MQMQEVTPEQWDRLLAARGKKMAQEAEIAKLTTIMNTMGSFLAKLTETDNTNKNAIEACLRSMAGELDYEYLNSLDITL